jgi:aquaporin Z
MSAPTITRGRDTQAAPQRSAATVRDGVSVRKYAVELIGTFLFVFAIGTAASLSGALAPLAIGSALMAMVYAGGHISGGHFNPAVTLGALVRGRIGPRDAVAYWVVQLVGAALAGWLVRWVILPVHDTALSLLNVATSRDNPTNSFYGLAIGFTVMVGAFAVGSISGGVFNPAVFVGAAITGLFAWSTIWVYFLAQLLAGVLAGLTFRALNPTDV